MSPSLRYHRFGNLQKQNLRARVSRPLTLKSIALFSSKRVSERPVRNHSQPPTTLSTTSVTDATFPLRFCAKRAQSAVRYVRLKRVTKPDGPAASSKLHLPLDRYIDDDTRPSLDDNRYDLAEILIIQDSTSRVLMIDHLICSHHQQRSKAFCFVAGPYIDGLRLRYQLTP